MKRIAVFFLQRNSRQYCRALLIQIMWLDYSRRTNSPIWAAWTKSATAWNEEPCEASLSQLSRVSTSDVHKDQLDHMSELYVLQGLRRRWLAEGVGFAAAPPHRSNGQKVKVDDPLVVQTVAHIRERIEQLRRREFWVYAGDIRTWGTSEQTERIPLRLAPVTDWSPAFAPHTFLKFLKSTHTLITRSRWVERVEAGLEPDPPGTSFFVELLTLL